VLTSIDVAAIDHQERNEMNFKKAPGGTRGANVRVTMWLMRPMRKLMIKQHRRSGNTFNGMDIIYLNTVGAKSGKARQTPLAYFPDDDGWLIVASIAGAANNPAWYHNIVAHPDQVKVEVGGRLHSVTPRQLEGSRREEAWDRIVASQSRYAEYQEKTDRVLPVILLTPVAG
jgi:deazaflavin-dependent oxidoreductase (nitroreductase family)